MSRTANVLAFAAAGLMLAAAAEASAQARTRADPTIRYEFMDGTFARDKPTFWYRPVSSTPDPAYSPVSSETYYAPTSSDAYAPTSSGVYTPVYTAPTASTYASDVSATVLAPTTVVISNAPVADTPQNRARFGGPDSRGGERTAPVGN